ncbi:MAG: DUF547 domain-containing protein [Blastocatellia bacterium]
MNSLHRQDLKTRRVALLLLLCICSAPAAVFPQTPRAINDSAFDYGEFDRLTRTYVNDAGLVNYAGLKKELSALKSFTDQLAAISPDSHPALFADDMEKLRYFATAYNAWVLYHITANYPKKDTLWGRFGGIGPKLKFKDQPIILGGQAASLETLEHKILRPRFADPRIHFYINCAAISCPPLPRGTIPAGKTSEALDAAARRFINNTKYVRYDPATSTLELSGIFKWFADDFLMYLQTRRGIKNPHIARYVSLFLDGPAAQSLATIAPERLKIRYLPYDTDLNEQP